MNNEVKQRLDQLSLNRERVFEALDDLGVQVWRDIESGELDRAVLRFNMIPAERRAYLAYTMIGLHTTNGGRVIALDDFFKATLR